MGLNFRNSTNLTVYVAFGYYKESCKIDNPYSPDNPLQYSYEVVGWYQVNPGQTVEVLNGAVNNQTIYYYAESISRSLTWSGGNFLTLPSYVFRTCGGVGYCGEPLCRVLGLRRITIGNYSNFIVNLVSRNIQGNSKFRNIHTAFPGKRPNMGRISRPGFRYGRVLRPRAGRKSISKR